ncbi:alpha-ribazole transporter [Dethiosulfatibacter aminovorans DSM 17477]|uniref:Alpha-ribazole transporter n=1 Tax=Dethiosulfatibacter aminovorans DSM 17477 TaxID=1121476 RepID=A0A1M6F2Z2_9FIRM|nr:ECF transporter S component [Dethiosulfatibacter aminovorans]SHI92088.1 alpha-ribazole transporter [Dethiosulfatibacter aminovorans DSM 17477]
MYKRKRRSLKSTESLVYLAVLIALSYIGSLIKIGPGGSIALDSMPAFFAALLMGPSAGAVVGFIGHLLTAATGGFPFTIPIHFIVAFEMAAICWIFGIMAERMNIVIPAVTATVLNGVVATFISVYAMELMGVVPSAIGMFKMLVGPLTIVSAVNVVLAVVLYRILRDRI